MNANQVVQNSPLWMLSEKTHSVCILDTGDEALLARIHLIRSAKQSICIQTYIWGNDETSRFVAYELIQAAKRGVQIRVLLDQWVSLGASEETAELIAFFTTCHPNVRIKYYNPIVHKVKSSHLKILGSVATHFRQANQRMHNKIFLVDNRFAIVGGRNYENDYFDRGSQRNFRDRDAVLSGPVVSSVSASFEEYWSFQWTVPSQEMTDVNQVISEGNTPFYESKEDFDIVGKFDDMERIASDPNEIENRLVRKCRTVRRVKFVADKPAKNQSRNLALELDAFLSQAERSILMQSPYLVFDKRAIQAFKRLRCTKPELDIRVSTNSLAATDNLYAYSISHRQRKMFLRDLKFQVFELKPFPQDLGMIVPRLESLEVPLCIHAKTYVVDEDITWVGSFNLDPRSVHLNTETALIVWDKAFAQEVKQSIQRDIQPQNSWTVGKCRKRVLRTYVSGLLDWILRKTNLVRIWPFRYAECFEIKQGMSPVPHYHPDFYKHYQSVGAYPEVPKNTREIEIALIQSFSNMLEPIV